MPQSDSGTGSDGNGSARLSAGAIAGSVGSVIGGEPNPLDGLSFRHPFRKYQKEIMELVKLKLEKGERELHIVAPPGAGKTIIGLQLLTELKVPSLVVCPTTTIQAQWGQKLDLFTPPEMEGLSLGNIIGTHEDKPLKPITMLTYQVLTTPGKDVEYLRNLAYDAWIAELCKNSPLSRGEAELRLMELMQNNKRAYDKELGRHMSRLRRKLADLIDIKDVLHPNSMMLINALRRQKFKVVIFDECHHLTDYWAAIMTHVVSQLDDPIVIGLTGTPPEGKSNSQEKRYLTLVGDIDYQVPTPALVKEGGLAPFQDLVLFTEPTEREEKFLEDQHEEFRVIIDELIASDPPLLKRWVKERLDGYVSDKSSSPLSRSSDLLAAMVRFAVKQKMKLPAGIDVSAQLKQPPTFEDWIEILEDFSLNFLKVSSSKENHKIYEDICSAVVKLGYGLTERGLRKQASPVDRVLAFSQSKPKAVATILDTEYRNLEDRLRCAVVTDFEKMSALSVKTTKGVLTTDSGGAIAVLRHLLSAPIGELVNPCMVTGSLMLVDRRIANRFVAAGREYLRAEGHYIDIQIKERVLPRTTASDIAQQDNKDDCGDGEDLADDAAEESWDEQDQELVFKDEDAFNLEVLPLAEAENKGKRGRKKTTTSGGGDAPPLADNKTAGTTARVGASPPKTGAYTDPDEPVFEEVAREDFVEITSSDSDWKARVYVGMATALLERGVTKCLIGTRGIFGEGWDCQSLNTLIDLTTTTTPMSVKQLRGRSLRINVNDPLGAHKVANNWDVVCVAPHLEKGLNDYRRFVRKHEGYFGISDDGQIECGVGHVHPSFSELTPAEVFSNYPEFNEEMTTRALIRDQIYELWKVGQPYHNRLLGCVEVSGIRKLALTPPNIRRDMVYKDHAAIMRASLNGLWLEYGGLGSFISGLMALGLAHWALPLYFAILPLIPAAALGRAKYVALYERLKAETCRPNTQESSLYDICIALLSALQQAKLLPKHVTKDSLRLSVRSDGSYRAFLDNVEPQQSEYFAKSLRELLSPVTNQPYLIPKYEFYFPREKKQKNGNEVPPNSNESFASEEAFFSAYLKGKAQPRVAAYHPVPSLLARSEKNREAFQASWNKYVSPGFVLATETNQEIINKYFGIGPSLAQRLLWE